MDKKVKATYKDMGLIAFGMVRAAGKRLDKLETEVEEIKKQIRDQSSQPAQES